MLLDSAVQFLSAENVPAVVNIACCTNMLNDYFTDHTRYVKLERLFRQKQLHHTGDHMKG